MTWNVWFGRHRQRERGAALLSEIAWRGADVIALQEVTEELLDLLTDDPVVRENFEITDADGSTFERYGVMLLSKIPITRASILPLPSQMGRRLVVAELANGLCVATVHLESTAPCIAERVEQLGIIQRHLASYPDVILLGDMNFGEDAPDESAAIDPRFQDAWLKNPFHDPGYTVDSHRNAMRQRIHGDYVQRRIDRAFVRSARWQVASVELAGVSPLDEQGTFVSDHFGLEIGLEGGPPVESS